MNEIKNEMKFRYSHIKIIIDHIKILSSFNNTFKIWNEISNEIEKSEFLTIISDEFTKKYSIEKNKYPDELENILKASIFLQMYNLIEYTIMSLFDIIHEEIKNYSYWELKEEIKKIIWITFKEWIKSTRNDQLITYISQLINIVDIKKEISFFIHSQRKKYSHYNYLWWNINKENFNKIREDYLINEITITDELDDVHFDNITDQRNLLAHWSKSFFEVWATYSLEEIENKLNCTFNYLNALVDWVELYLKNKDFIEEI